jgi:uncharacterized protein
MLRNLDQISPLPNEIVSFLNDVTLNKDIERILVFGSRAQGDYETYSDVDLAIDAPNISKIEWLKMREYVTYDLRTVLKISLVHYSTNPINLKERIINTGKEIYVK